MFPPPPMHVPMSQYPPMYPPYPYPMPYMHPNQQHYNSNMMHMPPYPITNNQQLQGTATTAATPPYKQFR